MLQYKKINWGLSRERQTMLEIHNGFFLVEEEMPCSPDELSFPRYILLDTLGNAEAEEAAARLISFSQDLNEWVGVSHERVMEQIRGDKVLQREFERVYWMNVEEENRTEKARRAWRILRLITFGLYALFVDEPVAQLASPPNAPRPISMVLGSTRGHVYIADGFKELIGRQLVRSICVGEGDQSCKVLVPTPALIANVVKYYRRPSEVRR